MRNYNPVTAATPFLSFLLYTDRSSHTHRCFSTPNVRQVAS